MPAQSLWMSDVEIDKCGYFSVVIDSLLPGTVMDTGSSPA